VSEGIAAMEELTGFGISCNATVSFSVAQAVSVAEAMERGYKKAQENKIDTENLRPCVTIMVGRIDDHITRVIQNQKINVDPGIAHWAGVAVFKEAHRIFKKRGFKAKLLVAAYRHPLHWTELIGSDVLMTIPYGWWTRFNKTDVLPVLSIEKPVDPKILDTLYNQVPDFKMAYEEGAMKLEEFVHYGATVHTLNQFFTGYESLLALVRARLIR
jgi:transaldolase